MGCEKEYPRGKAVKLFGLGRGAAPGGRQLFTDRDEFIYPSREPGKTVKRPVKRGRGPGVGGPGKYRFLNVSRDSYNRTFTSLLLFIYPARVSETIMPPSRNGRRFRPGRRPQVAQRAMRRKAAAARGRHNRTHTRPLSSFRCNTRHATHQVLSYASSRWVSP